MDENTHMQKSHLLSAKVLIAVGILFIYTIASSVFNKINFHYIHESGLSMLMGMAITLFAWLFGQVKYKI